MEENQDRVFRRFVDKWVTPTTVMILFGAVIWGVQLNWQIIENTKRIAANEELDAKQSELLGKLSEESTQRTYILQGFERRIVAREDYDERHDREANEWKQEIRLNSEERKRKNN